MAVFDLDLSQLDALGGKDKLDEVTLDAPQRKLMQDLSQLVGPSLGIDPIPCYGLWLQAVRRWQKRNQQHAVQISALPPAQRLKAAFEIKDHFVDLVETLLRDDAQRAALRATVDAAHSMYLAKYNKR